MNILKLSGISKTFNKKSVLECIDLSIDSGEISSIFGFSGEGKSTILKIVCGIIKQDKGSVFLNGENISNLEPYERGVSLVMDEPLLFPNMRVIDNIAFGIKLRKNNIKVDARKKAYDIMNLMGIAGLENRYPNEISMGQAQRVSIARSIVVNPKLILMDEPFSNLDIISKIKVRKLIKKINEELKISVLLVTHDIEDIMNLSDKMFILNNGKIQDSGSPSSVLRRPSSMDSAFLLGTENIFSGIVRQIDEANNTIKILMLNSKEPNNLKHKEIIIEADYERGFSVHEPVYFVIRPEEIMILREDRNPSKSVKENHFNVTISSSIYTSRMVDIIATEKSNAIEFKISLPIHAYEVMQLHEGKNISISLKKSAVHIINKKGKNRHGV